MKLNFQTWSDYHHQIYRIYHGMIALSLVPFFLLFLELEVANSEESQGAQMIEWLVLISFIPLSFYFCWTVWKGPRFTYDLKENQSIREKLILFRKVELEKYTWMSIACALVLLGLWLTSHYLFVICYFAILAQFSFLRPSEDRMIRTLRFTKRQREQLHANVFD